MDKRITAAEAYVLAMRTGEVPATEEAGKHLAKDVKLNGATVWGRQGATPRRPRRTSSTASRASGPTRPSTSRASGPSRGWKATRSRSGYVPGHGRRPGGGDLTFSFNANDQISQVDQEITPQPRPETTDYIPDSARGLINGALRNNTPMTVAYVDEDGKPNMSLRGSVQVYSPTQLCDLAAQQGGRHAHVPEDHPTIGLLYRDTNSRSTLVDPGHRPRRRRTRRSASACGTASRTWSRSTRRVTSAVR